MSENARIESAERELARLVGEARMLGLNTVRAAGQRAIDLGRNVPDFELGVLTAFIAGAREALRKHRLTGNYALVRQVVAAVLESVPESEVEQAMQTLGFKRK